MDIELRTLELKYLTLRVIDPNAQARLVASLAELGQQNAVLVVHRDGRPVLIDGYRRVLALQSLRRDLVLVTRLELAEAEALLLRHRMASAERRSALEEAWLLRELHDGFSLSLDELARRFVRSKSWVSRRLAVLQVLPAAVQQLIREGRLSVQAAMKHLVPLARGNDEWAERLAHTAADARLSVRQLGELVDAWRYAAPEQRQRIVDHPELFLRAKAFTAAQPAPVPPPLDADLLHELERLAALVRRIRLLAATVAKQHPGVPARDLILTTWQQTSREVMRLGDLLVYGLDRAE